MSQPLLAALQKGIPMRELVKKLGAVTVDGKPLTVRVEDRCVPYLSSTVAGWVDGPPTSSVAFVLSGADGHGWRRWTVSRVSPTVVELGVFPTPFKNEQDPLSPGVPPSSSRAR